MSPLIDTVKIIKLPHHIEDNGDLVVMEGMLNVPFEIARVFVVRAPERALRGDHAHRACTQFLTCPIGIVDVECDDGLQTASFVLDHPKFGLLVPAGIWSRQTYRTRGSTLTVLCDRHYEAHDYIREYQDYLAYRQANAAIQRRDIQREIMR